MCIFTYTLFFTASPGQRLSNDLSAPSTLRTHRTKLTPRRPPAFRGEVTLNQPFTHTPPPTTTTPRGLPPLHTTTTQEPTPHNHSFGPHRQKWYVQPIGPCSGSSECATTGTARDGAEPKIARALVNNNTPPGPLSREFLFRRSSSLSQYLAYSRARRQRSVQANITKPDIPQTANQPWTNRRKAQTSRRPSPSSTSAATAVSRSATLVISSEHVARTPRSQRSRTSRLRWAATVSRHSPASCEKRRAQRHTLTTRFSSRLRQLPARPQPPRRLPRPRRA
jgi:hypothetical protein